MRDLAKRRAFNLATTTQTFVDVPTLAVCVEESERAILRLIHEGTLQAERAPGRRKWKIRVESARTAYPGVFHAQQRAS